MSTPKITLAAALACGVLGCWPCAAIAADRADPVAISQMWQRVQKMTPEQREIQWSALEPAMRSKVRASLEAGAKHKSGRPAADRIRKIPAFTARYR